MTFLRKAESNCDVLFFPIAKLILLLGLKLSRELSPTFPMHFGNVVCDVTDVIISTTSSRVLVG